jgi:phosphate transport system substrate-binding protein
MRVCGALCVLFLCNTFPVGALGRAISGVGATFPYPVYAKWAAVYQAETGIEINYQSIGSGGGIKQIKTGTVAFGATDAPLLSEELDRFHLIQFPTLIGGIVLVTNIGIPNTELILDHSTLAGIFLGRITKWNDPALVSLNPHLSLPKDYIIVVHRADGSGTTFNFTRYLSELDTEWNTEVGSNMMVAWPVGIGAKGNEGVANNVARMRGAIGYVEYTYAKQNKLSMTRLINREGNIIAPSPETIQAAAGNAPWLNTPGFGLILTNQPGKQSWPLAAATYILMSKKPRTADDTLYTLNFFSWAYHKGEKIAEDLDYAVIPKNVIESVETLWKKTFSKENF